MNSQLKESLISTGDQAFIALTQQIQHLLDLIDFYVVRYPVDDSKKCDGLALKHEELMEAVNILGSLPYRLADEIRRWKHEEPRILSRLGVEIELLNEIWCTMEALFLFFTRQDIDVHPYNRSKAERAFAELVRSNRLL